jgi:hypothetical protein
MRGATTGAALTEPATEAWTTQPNVVPQHGEQRSIRIIDVHVTARPFTCSVGLMAVSGGQPIGRSHKFGADGLLDAGGNDAIDLAHRGSIDLPARNLADGVELIRPARAP